MNVCQSHIAATESKRGFRMLDAHQIKHRCVQVMDFRAVFNRLVPPLIRRTIDEPRLHTSASHPACKTERIVIPTVLTLSERGSPELSGPDDESFIQEATLPKIL